MRRRLGGRYAFVKEFSDFAASTLISAQLETMTRVVEARPSSLETVYLGGTATLQDIEDLRLSCPFFRRAKDGSSPPF
jgi:hypothetical protein